MTELVKVDVQCPFCGGCYHRMVKIKPSSICCKVCKKSLFLEWTGSTPTSTNKAGFGRLAYAPYNNNEEIMEFNEVFDCEDIEIEAMKSLSI